MAFWKNWDDKTAGGTISVDWTDPKNAGGLDLGMRSRKDALPLPQALTVWLSLTRLEQRLSQTQMQINERAHAETAHSLRDSDAKVLRPSDLSAVLRRRRPILLPACQWPVCQ